MIVLKGILGIVLFCGFIALLMMFISWVTGANIGSKYSNAASYTPDDLPNAVKYISRKGSDVIQKLSPSSKQKVLDSLGDKTEGKLVRLEKLVKLRDSGAINNEEFNLLKDEILSAKSKS